MGQKIFVILDSIRSVDIHFCLRSVMDKISKHGENDKKGEKVMKNMKDSHHLLSFKTLISRRSFPVTRV